MSEKTVAKLHCFSSHIWILISNYILSIISHSIAPRANVSYVAIHAELDLVSSCLCTFTEESAPAVLFIIYNYVLQ